MIRKKEMQDNKEIIIINAIPNNREKITMLEAQLSYLKKLDTPIMIVSGCDVPQEISKQVDYVIINKDNEVIEKDYSCKMYRAGLHDLSYDHATLGNYLCLFYWKTVNSTITKNIKLGFNTAKTLGYARAFYTEDDNIFKDGSFYYLQENLNALRNEGYKLAGWTGHLDTDKPMMCTAFFFADIDWMVSNFTLPHQKEEWYDYNTTVKYHLHRPYEFVFYKFFEDKLKTDFYDSQGSYVHLEKNNLFNELMEFGKSNRRFSEKNLIETFFTILAVDNVEGKPKILVMNNTTHYLPEGGKNYNIRIFFDDVFQESRFLNTGAWVYKFIPENVKQVKLIIDGYGTRTLDADLSEVFNNGHAIDLTNI